MSTTVPASTADTPAALQAATLCEAFQLTAAQRPDQVALRVPGGAQEITWRDYAARVRELAAGLAALGVTRGDTVGLMLVNRPEFHLVDSAAMHLGATPFSVYNTSPAEQVAYLFSNAGNRVVITERQFLDTIRAAASAHGSRVEHVVCIDEDAALDDLAARGEDRFDFDAAWRAVRPDDVLTLIYTSGTTGPPKGVQLTHRGQMTEVRGTYAVMPAPMGGRMVSFLPSAHIADRWASHYFASMTLGATITCVADPRAVVAALPETRPTFWGSVPRIWEKIKAALEAQGIVDPAALSDEQRAGVRAKLGLDQARYLVVGAAPTPLPVFEYFDALGLPLCEVWGMSETNCVVTFNPREALRYGTCGKPIPGAELRLAEDGELLVRGDLLMAGYRNDPEKTAETIDADGWLHTGDIAEIDADGYLRIVDRKKELIINAAGKNMSPANIEAKLKASSPLIGQAVCIGDMRPYNVALIVLDPDNAAAFATANGLPDDIAELAQSEPVRREVERGVAAANAALARVEQIKRFTILPEDWLPGGDELTPTMKLKRKPIAAKYAAEIDALYF